jgi:ankyrin repeat protein
MIELLVQHAPQSIRETTPDGLLPLHVAASHAGPSEKAEFLVRQVTPGGLTPLHCAVGKASLADHESLGLARFLLAAWPEAIQQTTNEGLLPLHCLVGRTVPHYIYDARERLALTRLLVGRWPPSLHVPTPCGRLAIHLAAASTAPVEVLQLLVEAHPEALQARDDGGSLPLHLAVARTELDLEVVRYLVRQRPEAVRERDGRGSLPLHVAVSTRPASTVLGGKAEAGILKALVDAWPQSIHEAGGGGGPDGLIPLHLAAASDAPLLVVFWLLRLCPDSIRQRPAAPRMV